MPISNSSENGGTRKSTIPPVFTAVRAPLAVAFLVGALTACGSLGERTVSGLRDDVQYWPEKTVADRRPHMVKQCTIGNERVKHTSSTGSGKSRRTQSWYTTERRQSCKNVQKGTERYNRVVRHTRWCVELDNVNGKSSRDDRWFEVNASTYHTAVNTKEGDKLSFTPLSSGC